MREGNRPGEAETSDADGSTGGVGRGSSRDLVLTAGRVVPRRARPRRGCAANTGGGKRTTLLQHVGCSAPPRRRRGDSISRASRSDLGRVSCAKPRQTALARFFCRETCRKESLGRGSGWTPRFSRPRPRLDVYKLLELRLYRVRQTEDTIDIPIEGFVVTRFDRKRAAARRTSRRASWRARAIGPRRAPWADPHRERRPWPRRPSRDT